MHPSSLAGQGWVRVRVRVRRMYAWSRFKESFIRWMQIVAKVERECAPMERQRACRWIRDLAHVRLLSAGPLLCVSVFVCARHQQTQQICPLSLRRLRRGRRPCLRVHSPQLRAPIAPPRPARRRRRREAVAPPPQRAAPQKAPQVAQAAAWGSRGVRCAERLGAAVG